MSDSPPVASQQYNHVVIEVPTYGVRDAAHEVLVYRVGPAINWSFFQTYRTTKLVLWGDNLDQKTLRRLGDACHELEQEHAEMGLYEAARGADQMEGKFIFSDYRESGV